MTFAELLAHLAGKLRVDALAPDAEGQCRLVFEGGLVTRLFPHGRNLLYLEGELGLLPDRPGEAEQALRQTLGRATALMLDRPEIVALDEEKNSLVLYRKFALDTLTPEDFDTEFAAFLNEMELWRNRQEAAPAAPPMPMMIFP